ncbi:hypothetical protein [Chitinivorax sp. B]|uniref:hypothetical protein n=1 Tax=Chitinivorax sp. B TaxID=2502235 RepID=UPI0010F9AF89|nr:hypothetical protein [Chitinivorax sp. B]
MQTWWSLSDRVVLNVPYADRPDVDEPFQPDPGNCEWAQSFFQAKLFRLVDTGLANCPTAFWDGAQRGVAVPNHI